MANGEFSPQELRDFFQSYSNRTMAPLGTNHIKSKRAAAREQQLFFTLENLPHRTWRRRISLTPST